MSMVISYKKSDSSTFLSDKLPSMNSSTESPLVVFLRQVLVDTGLNYRQVAERSGGAITHSTVHDILAGRSKNPTTFTLKGLAKGLGVPEEIVFEAARGGPAITTASVESELLSYVKELSDVRKNDLLHFAKMFFHEQAKEGFLFFRAPERAGGYQDGIRTTTINVGDTEAATATGRRKAK